jgi:hypothetical protein
MGAKKDRKGSGQLKVHSLTEAMGMGERVRVGDPPAPTTVRHVAGQHPGGKGPGTAGSAEPFKTIHKGKGWDGPPVRKTLTPKYNPRSGD